MSTRVSSGSDHPPRALSWGAAAVVIVPVYFMPFALLVEDLLMFGVFAAKAAFNGVLAAVSRSRG